MKILTKHHYSRRSDRQKGFTPLETKITIRNNKTGLGRSQAGFTIVELLIATSVFSVMLLIATSGLIQIGRVYYKGITTAKTQETARGIVAEIAESIQVGSNTNIAENLPVPGPGPHGEQAFCVGNVRYTYAINWQVKPVDDRTNTAAPKSKHGLWLDLKNAGDPCSALDLTVDIPGDPTSDPAGASKSRELLGANMRVTQFNIEQPIASNSNLVNVSVTVVYGDHDLTNDNGPGTADDSCISSRFGGQFCAISALSVFVKKRL